MGRVRRGEWRKGARFGKSWQERSIATVYDAEQLSVQKYYRKKQQSKAKVAEKTSKKMGKKNW